ncbi:MAG: ImmA/IrrE family metallo-endopeptidase [bacterium]
MTLQVTPSRQWLRAEFIESKALARLEAYEEEYGAISSLPIPVHHLIEAHLDLFIDWDDILAPEEDEPVLAYINPTTRTIRMNAKRRRYFDEFFGSETFTLGHEVGHWDLHILEAEAVQLPLFDADQLEPFVCRGDPRRRLEWQANRYSAALIMPARMIEKLTAGVDLCAWPNLYDLKDRFQVTISALTRRLVELGLIYKSPEGNLYPSREAYHGQNALF